LFGMEGFKVNGAVAILIIHTYSFYVFFYAMAAAALEGIDQSQIEAARTLGASRARVFWRVTVPMLTPALLGASLLTFMTSGASFSAPLFFGDNFPVLSVEIYQANTNFQAREALTLTVMLACVSLLGLLLFRSRREAGGVASKGTPREMKSAPGRIAAAAAAWAFIGLLVTPHLIILWLSFVDHRAWQAELVPKDLTWKNYAAIFTDPAAFGPIKNSLWMSVGAALATLAVGLPCAYLIGRAKPGSRTLGFMVMIPWALPGTVIAMNLITAFNDPWLPLYNTVFILPLAYFVRNIPLFTRMVSAAIVQFDGSLIEAGRTLGASRFFCFRKIIVPLLAPSLVAATALVFAACLGEFIASILLFSPANIPIAVQINMQWRASGIGSAFAYSVFLLIIVTATFLFSRRFASRII
ncbi:MAG: iron ABC transporter permease, partial [Candidatus Hydrogenedentes bacterium]|nr:iron ABC transporter permease [Candidatus Hydrogenedentota bacterium]